MPKIAVVPNELPPCIKIFDPVIFTYEAVKAWEALTAQLEVILYVPTGKNEAV